MASKRLAATAVGAGIALSRLFGLVRERAFAHVVGNSPAAGVFRAALRIPNLLQNLFGEGALSASFIPVYARLMADGRSDEARALAASVFAALIAACGVVVVLGVTFAESWIQVLAPGFQGAERTLAVELVRIMFPGVGLLVVSAWCLGVLNSHRHFFLSYVAPTLWNAAIIAALFVAYAQGRGAAGAAVSESTLSPLMRWDYAVRLASWGTVAGAALQLLVQMPLTLRLLGGAGALKSWRKPGRALREVATNFLPAVLSRGVVQISAYIDQILSSYLGAQVVSGIAYAQTLYLLPFSLFGISIAAAELPDMARVGADDAAAQTKLRERLAASTRKLGFLIMPSSVGLMLLGQDVASVVLQTGRFAESDAAAVGDLVQAMGVGLFAATSSRLLVSVYWALKDTRRPALISLLRVVLSGVIGAGCVLWLRPRLGWSEHQGAVALMLANGVVSWIEFALLRGILKRKVGWQGVSLGFWGRLAGAAVAAAAVGGGGDHLARTTLAELAPLLRGVAALGAFGACYCAFAWALRVEEARKAVARATSVILRRGR
jgi:putative peptidoglycan lipid II flippase